MLPNEYQDMAMRTCPEQSDDRMMLNAIIGLSGEVGELAEQIKHHEFQGHPLCITNIKEELGDVLWYVCQMCLAIGTDLEQIMAINIAKLAKRYPEGFSTEGSLNRDTNEEFNLMHEFKERKEIE